MIQHKTPVTFEAETFKEWFELVSAVVTRRIIADIDQIFAKVQSGSREVQANDLGESVTERIIRDIKAKGYSSIEHIVCSGQELNYIFRVI